MLLFLAAVADQPDQELSLDVRAPLDRLARETGYFGTERAELWRAGPLAIGTLTHSAEMLGTARHVASTDRRLAAFSGRPIRIRADGTADGRDCLDASTYLAPLDEWESELDGRFVVLVAEADGLLRVVTDPLGQYPVYTARVDGATLVSNNARLLADLTGGGIRPSVAACALLSELVPDALPLWERVDTLRPGSTHSICLGRSEVEERWRPGLLELLSRQTPPSDPVGEGARRLVAAAAALCDWPGRPSAVPLSGGHDSRLVFAAVEAAGVTADIRTVAILEDPDYPETTDVRIARNVAAAAGRPHRVVEQYDPASYVSELDRFAWISPGTFSIRLTLPVEPAPAGEPLELVHSGQNGEWMRAKYGAGTTLREIEREARAGLLPRVPAPLLTDDAYALANDWLSGSLRELLSYGFRERDLADAFTMTQDVPTYGPPSHRVYEYRYDTTFPACLMTLAPIVLGRPQAERVRPGLGESFVTALVPALRDVRYDHSDEAGGPAAAQRLLSLAEKVVRELRRRRSVARSRRAGSLQRMPFLEMHAAVARAYRDGMTHPALEVVHRARLERVLRQDPWRVTPPDRRAVFLVGTWLLASPR